MIKTAIDIEKAEKNKFEGVKWAFNYLTKNDLLDYLIILKKTRRNYALPMLLRSLNKENLLNEIECNAKGHVVFKWENKEEKTFFLLKWS